MIDKNAMKEIGNKFMDSCITALNNAMDKRTLAYNRALRIRYTKELRELEDEYAKTWRINFIKRFSLSDRIGSLKETISTIERQSAELKEAILARG